jgi:hypothetical protein
MDSARLACHRIGHQSDDRGFAGIPAETVIYLEKADVEAAAFDKVSFA